MTAVLGFGGIMLIASAVMFLLRTGSRRAYRKVAGTPPTELGRVGRIALSAREVSRHGLTAAFTWAG